ncbi:MAG TPA: ABC transporter permease [Vicinamibacterales bacterium]|nr:ABC transporter permease [Vicinamibacterales bacterium]
MSSILQMFAVTGVTLRSIGQRLGSSAVAIVGIAGVVVVFTGVLSIAEGFQTAMSERGDPLRVLVLRSGANTEMTSGLGGEEARIIVDAPGIARSDDGPVASPELFVIVGHPLKRSGTDANVPLRGISPAALRVRPEVRIVEGRMFQSGTNEIVVGRAAARQFDGLYVGRTVRWGESSWQVVGIFDAGGSVAESELWCDARVLQPAYRRGNSYQSVLARLESPDAFQTLKDALTSDPRLQVSVMRERDYYAEQSRVMQTIIRTIGIGIAVLMGLGAIFGAVNTMYSAVSSRTREIATLRALGFGRLPVVVSVLVEALLLSIVGGAIGGGLAWAAFDGYQTATMNWQSFSQVAFSFEVTPSLLVRGLVYAMLMGLVGGLLPAIRAARLPVVSALRQL